MQEKFQTNRAGCAGDNGRAGFARLFFSILQLCPRRPGRNFSNLKFPSGPTFALQLLPGRGRGEGCLYCARQRCPRCGYSTSTRGWLRQWLTSPFFDQTPVRLRWNFSFRKHTSYRRFSFEALFARRRYCQQVNSPILVSISLSLSLSPPSPSSY